MQQDTGALRDERLAGAPARELAAWACPIAALLAFLCAQRFAAPAVSAYVCLVPAVLAALYWRRPTHRNLLIALALLAKVDSSDTFYMETSSFVRLPIYAMAFAVVMADFSAPSRRLIAFFAYVCILIGFTLANRVDIDAYSLARDVITLFLVLGLVGTTPRGARQMMRLEVLVWFSAGLLVAELLNVAFFYPSDSENYLGYDSLKCIVTFASLYALVNGWLIASAVLCTGTLVVLIGYSTRMLLVAYVVTVVVVALSPGAARSGRLAAAGLVGAGVLGAALFLSQDFIESSRVFSFFYSLSESGDWLDYARLLDPVRFVEHEMFLARPWPELLFGSGLGSGLIDVTGQLAFVQPGTGAFSDREILEARYFRLHDTWIYFGMRLGLVFVVFAYGLFLRWMLSASRERVLWAALGVLMFTTATFSIAGLFMSALVTKQLLTGGARGDEGFR